MQVWNIILILATFSLMILIHEIGHLIVAKKTGMLVSEFALGFGKKLFSRKIGETEYSLRLIPLGGFNDIKIDANDVTSDRDFYAKPLWARISVLAAGGVFNMASAYIAMVLLINVWGVPNPIPVIDKTLEASAAYNYLQEGDRILAIDGKKIEEYQKLASKYIYDSSKLDMTIERNGKEISVFLTKTPNTKLGVQFASEYRTISFPESLWKAKQIYWDFCKTIAEGIRMVRDGEVKTTEAISGPIGVGHAIYKANDSAGIRGVIIVFALLSINLGIMNLLPIPCLDGGHIIIQIVETIVGKNMNEKQIQYVSYAGMTVLGGLFIFGMYSDVLRLLR